MGASKIQIDDNNKTVTLWDGAINNGAQSQGEIRLYRKECEDDGEEPADFNVRAEISVEPNAAMRTEIAIARNTATKIQDISSAGAQGYFDHLAEAFGKVHPDRKLARSETDVGDEYVDTRLVLQVLWALMPEGLMPEGRVSIEARMRSYRERGGLLG